MSAVFVSVVFVSVVFVTIVFVTAVFVSGVFMFVVAAALVVLVELVVTVAMIVSIVRSSLAMIFPTVLDIFDKPWTIPSPVTDDFASVSHSGGEEVEDPCPDKPDRFTVEAISMSSVQSMVEVGLHEYCPR